MKRLFFLILGIFLIASVSAFDTETIFTCAGDQETLIHCVGDSELSFMAETDLKEGGGVVPSSISEKRISEPLFTNIIKKIKEIADIPLIWIIPLLFFIFIILYVLYHRQKN